MAIFSKKSHGELSRRDFRQILKTAPARIPGSGGKIYSRQERIKMEAEVFPRQRFGSHISEIECRKRERELRQEKYRAKTREEKFKIDRKLQFLKGVTGVDPYQR